MPQVHSSGEAPLKSLRPKIRAWFRLQPGSRRSGCRPKPIMAENAGFSLFFQALAAHRKEAVSLGPLERCFQLMPLRARQLQAEFSSSPGLKCLEGSHSARLILILGLAVLESKS